MVRITGLLLAVCIHHAVLGDEEEVSYNEIDGHPQTTYTKQIGQDDSILIKNLKEKVSKQSRTHRGPELSTGEGKLEVFHEEKMEDQ